MFTLVVTNRKGGTAKTTTAVNLAAEFSKQGRRCLLIDLDPQGHCGLGVGAQTQNRTSDHHHILANSRQALDKLLHETSHDNLFFIPPGRKTENQEFKKERLQKFLSRKQLHSYFDIAVVDTPPNAGLEQEAAIHAADGVLIPFLPTPLGKTGIKDLMQDLSKTPYGLIPIMLDNRVNLDKQILSDVIAEHGTEKILRGVRRNVKLAEAFDAGQPVNIFDAKSRGAFDYHMLAEDIASLWPRLYPRQTPLSFREQAQIKRFPRKLPEKPVKPVTEESTVTHRGIRLKDKCVQWNG